MKYIIKHTMLSLILLFVIGCTIKHYVYKHDLMVVTNKMICNSTTGKKYVYDIRIYK